MFLSGSRQRHCGSGIAAARRDEPGLRSGSAAGDTRGSLEGRLRQAIPALLLGGLSLTALPAAAAADSSTDDLNKLRAEIQKEIGALKKQEAKLHQQFLDLDRKSKLLDRKSELLEFATAQHACHRQRRRERCSGRSRSARLDGDDIEFSAGKRYSRTHRYRGGPIPGFSAVSSCGPGRSARHAPGER